MKNLNGYYEECRDILTDLGISVGKVVDVVTNDKAQSRWGCCRKVGYNGFRIEINPILLMDKVDDVALYNTMIHELLHTVKGCWSHTGRWKLLADKVNQEYGLHVQRVDGDKDDDAVAEIEKKQREKRERKNKYFIGCPECGAKWGYATCCQAVQHPEWYRCRKCKVKLINL